jgi:hypothetical protein
MEAFIKLKKPTKTPIKKKRRVSRAKSNTLFVKEAERFFDLMTSDQQRKVLNAYLNEWEKYPDYLRLSPYTISYWKQVVTHCGDEEEEFQNVLQNMKTHILDFDWMQSSALKQLYALAVKQQLAGEKEAGGKKETKAPAQHVRGPIKNALKMMKAVFRMQQEVSDMQRAVDRRLSGGEQIGLVAVEVPPSPLAEETARGALTLLPSTMTPASAVEGEISSPEIPSAIEEVMHSKKGAPSGEKTTPLEEQELVYPSTPRTPEWGASPDMEQDEKTERQIEQLSSPSFLSISSDMSPPPSEAKADSYYYYYY